MKLFGLLISALFLFSATLEAQTFSWAKAWGNSQWDNVNGIAVARDGSSYIAGRFESMVDFDPGPSVHSLTATGKDGYVTRLSASGDWVFTYPFGGAGNDDCKDVIIDGSGNVVITGQFENTVDFDPGSSVTNLTAAGSDGFVVKLDPAGNFIWAIAIGGASSGVNVFDMDVDRDKNIYLTGSFYGTIDADPSAGVVNLSTSNSSSDPFVCKLDSNGALVWARSFTGPGTNKANSIAVDSEQHVLVAGLLYGTADFDPGPGVQNVTCLKSRSAFVAKLNATGEYLWAHALGGEGLGLPGVVTVDQDDHVYTSGWFEGSSDFNPASGEADTAFLTSKGVLAYTGDVFIQKMDPMGNFLWVKQLGGPDVVLSENISLGPDGNIYTVGQFSGQVDMDPGTQPADTFIVQCKGITDAYINVLSPQGAFVKNIQIGGSGNETPTELGFDQSGNVYLSGVFLDTTDLDPGIAIAPFYSNGLYDAFILKLGDNSTGLSDFIHPFPLQAFPNPSGNGRYQLDLIDTYDKVRVRVSTLEGQQILSEYYENSHFIDLYIPGADGLYIVEVQADGKNASFKLMKKRD